MYTSNDLLKQGKIWTVCNHLQPMKEDIPRPLGWVLPYSVKGEGVLQVEGERWSEERGVLQLPQHTHTEEDRRTSQMDGRTRGLLPL